MIINVEYNQLDPILRATVSPEGDVNDPNTGLSPYPGNTNNLVLMLDPYLKVYSADPLPFSNPQIASRHGAIRPIPVPGMTVKAASVLWKITKILPTQRHRKLRIFASLPLKYIFGH